MYAMYMMILNKYYSYIHVYVAFYCWRTTLYNF